MAAGPAGPGGVAAQPVFARETNASEQEPAPIQLQVKMELIVKEIAHMPLERARHPGRKCTGHERSRSWYLVSIQLVTSFYLFIGKLEYPNKIIRFNTSIVRMKMNPCEEIRRR